MTTYQHRFDRIEDYLHHRPPYLLVDAIVSIDHQRIVTQTSIVGDEFFIQGHFPGAPILPGAMMQEMTTQSAGILIAAEHNPMAEYNTHDPEFNELALGVLVRVTRARYRGFARPGDLLQAEVTLNEQVGDMFDFSGVVKRDGQTILQNSFRLTNLSSRELRGDA